MCVCVCDHFHIETNFHHPSYIIFFVKHPVSQINTQDYGNKIGFIDFNLIYSTWKWRHVAGCFWWVIILRPRSCVFGFIWYIAAQTGDIVLVRQKSTSLHNEAVPCIITTWTLISETWRSGEAVGHDMLGCRWRVCVCVWCVFSEPPSLC